METDSTAHPIEALRLIVALFGVLINGLGLVRARAARVAVNADPTATERRRYMADATQGVSVFMLLCHGILARIAYTAIQTPGGLPTTALAWESNLGQVAIGVILSVFSFWFEHVQVSAERIERAERRGNADRG